MLAIAGPLNVFLSKVVSLVLDGAVGFTLEEQDVGLLWDEKESSCGLQVIPKICSVKKGSSRLI